MKSNYFNFFIMILCSLICGVVFSFEDKKAPNSFPKTGALTPGKRLLRNLETIKKLPYDDELYQVTYQTLVYNSSIDAAFQLALIGVEKNPTNLDWHEKLAQAATWLENYDFALKEWLYVVEHSNNKEVIKHAISIAKTINYYNVLEKMIEIYLTKFPAEPQDYIDLAMAQNKQDDTNAALATLKKLNTEMPTRQSYEAYASIYQDLGDWSASLRTWDKINANYGYTVKGSMTQAEMYYMSKQYQKSLAILKKTLPVAKKSDKEYWQTLGEMGWLLNDRKMAILGFSHNQDNESNLINLATLEYITNPSKSYDYSFRGWNKFHNKIFFVNSVNLAQQLGMWFAINKLLMELNHHQLEMVKNTESFWSAQAGLYAAYGDEARQQLVLKQGILLNPSMDLLKINLLWLAISSGDMLLTKQLMEKWYVQGLWMEPIFWHVYANGFDMLNMVNTSLSMFQMHLKNILNHEQVIIDYANLLQRAKLDQQAYDVWIYLWRRSLNEYKKYSPADKQTLRTIIQVAPYMVSGTDQVNLAHLIFNKEMENEDINILLNWMVPRQYFDLVLYFKNNFMLRNLPDWAEINMALVKNDQPTLQKILEHTEREWPRADRINAAVRRENIPLALDLGFHEMTERPKAAEIHTEYVLYALKEAENFSFALEQEQFVNVVGLRTKLATKQRLTNSLDIRPYLNVWKMRSNQEIFITNVPSLNTEAGFDLEQKIHRGDVTYAAEYRNSLNSITPLSAKLNYQIDARLNGHIEIGYDQKCFQNSYMYVGGMEDHVDLGGINSVTKYDAFYGDIWWINYYGQDRHYLANGYTLQASWEHKFWLEYPDFTLGAFTNFYHFNRNGDFGGDIATLFPTLPPSQAQDPAAIEANNSSNYQQVIPNDYHEYGLMFNFGATILDYSHDWRPYFVTRLYYNTVTYLSNEIKVGFNGSLIGRDSLLLYGERGTSPATAEQTNYIFGLRYMIYF